MIKMVDKFSLGENDTLVKKINEIILKLNKLEERINTIDKIVSLFDDDCK